MLSNSIVGIEETLKRLHSLHERASGLADRLLGQQPANPAKSAVTSVASSDTERLSQLADWIAGASHAIGEDLERLERL